MAWYDQPKQRRHPGVDAYIEMLEAPQRELVEAIRTIAHGCGSDVVECLAWKVPAWFRENQTGLIPIGYASAASAHVTVGMFRGVEIQDRAALLTGTGKSPIRKAVVKLRGEPPLDAITDWYAQGYNLPYDD